jgi:hypothetical protein
MCNKLRDDYEAKNVTVVHPQQEPLPSPPYRIPQMSDTSYYAGQNSETSYITILEGATLRVKGWIFNQMWDELIDNCVTEGENESHS